MTGFINVSAEALVNINKDRLRSEPHRLMSSLWLKVDVTLHLGSGHLDDCTAGPSRWVLFPD